MALHLEVEFGNDMHHSKGARQRLRFTKSGDAKLEEADATHFVWPGNGPFHPPRPGKSPE